MLRTAAKKVAWVGRTTSMVFGLALVLALLFGAASVALGATGGTFLLGKANTAGAISKLTANIANPALKLINTSTGTAATALNLTVASNKPPMTVNPAAGTATNLSADKLDGKDFGAFDAVQVIQAPGQGPLSGPLPVERTFTSQGGTLVISVAGSGFRGTGQSLLEGPIGMIVFVDNTTEGILEVYTNERNSHKAFVSKYIVLKGLPAGQHTIKLNALRDSACNTVNETKSNICTSTDSNDYFSVTIEEMPD